MSQLVGRPVLLAANGGSDRHALVVDHALRPLFAFFRALTVPSAVYSKEHRSDCPLAALAVVLDSSGFVRRSGVFAGNASEPATLQDLFGGLGAPKGVAVVMDAAGIATAATEANLAWLKTND